MDFAVQRIHPLADVLGEIADPFEFVAIRKIPTISRRSTAIGWRVAMVAIAFCSISRFVSIKFSHPPGRRAHHARCHILPAR